MNAKLNTLLSAALLLGFMLAPAAEAQGKYIPSRASAPVSNSYSGGGDCDLGTAQVDLDVNNVRARLFNTGGLFWKGGNPVYEVPLGSGIQSVFASGIWIGGMIGEELHFAGADYSDWEFWPGPLGPDGSPPSDCTIYDRFWKVNRTDIEAFERGEGSTSDLASWPTDLGAPFYDADGNGIYDINAGDRPAIIIDENDADLSPSRNYVTSLDDAVFPDQQIFWVMNDMGNAHVWGGAQPLVIEIQATAFAFATADAIGNTTFYKYKLVYKNTEVMSDVWFGLWSDPDLGEFNDDFVGSDPVLGIGYVYNGDNDDVGNYGTRPPALAYDFFQGPLVDDDGIDNDGDGEIDEANERLGMERFLYYNNNANPVNGNPDDADDAYNYLRGIWRDESLVTFGGDGTDQSNPPTEFMFPDDPPNFWSEDNTDGAGGRNNPADRRFLMSAGPFTLEPGDVQDIVFGIQWARTSSTASRNPRIASLRQLEFENVIVQGAFNSNFNVPRPPDAPIVEVTELDGKVILTWSNPVNSNNFRGSYEVVSPFADPSAPDDTYNFEGFRVLQFQSLLDTDPAGADELAVLDVPNGVGTIIDNVIDPNSGEVVTNVIVGGGDTGVEFHFVIENLTNSTEYTFAVQAYAFNEFSSPLKVYASPITLGTNLVQAIPSMHDPRDGGLDILSGIGDPIAFSTGGPNTDAEVFVEVLNPRAVTGDRYRIDILERMGDEPCTPDSTEGDDHTYFTFTISNLTTGQVVLDPDEFSVESGRPGCFLAAGGLAATDQFYIDGLLISVDPKLGVGSYADGASIVEVQYGSSLTCEADPSLDGCEAYGGQEIYRNLTPSHGDYYMSSGSGEGEIETLLRYFEAAAPFDYEMRFTENCATPGNCFGAHGFTDDVISTVPFEIWQTGIATPDDPSDDIRMVPFLFENPDTFPEYQYGTSPNNWPDDTTHLVSDLTYFMYPDRDNGYDLFHAAAVGFGGAGATYDRTADGDVLIDQDLFNGVDCGAQGYYTNHCYRNQDFALNPGGSGFIYPIGRTVLGDLAGDMTPPPVGTVIRFISEKPATAENFFTFDTAPFAESGDNADIAASALELIGIVPNPYRARSAYETGSTERIARFVNLPGAATIRIFTLAGTLIRTLEKADAGTILDWDLRTESGLPIASGLYLIHVDVPGVGETILKFGIIQRRTVLDVL